MAKLKMQIIFNRNLLDKYKSAAQRARVLSEQWVHSQSYCPNCGQNSLEKYESGRPVADFYCAKCREEFELKSKKTIIGRRVVDGAFSTMIDRLNSSTNPNLFLLSYDLIDLIVNDFLIIPKHFFTPEIIEQRRALSPSAQRAGWIGCNILLDGIPLSGRIYLVKNRQIEPIETVLSIWKKTLFLRDETDLKTRGWLLDIMGCIDKLGYREFSLDQIYSFEFELEKKHPDNRHIKEKIRQQLQVLRDTGYLEFVERGHYRLIDQK